MNPTRKLALLLPFYKSVTPQTTVSILNLLDRQTMQVLHRWGDAFIVHTRNRLANMFMETELEWSLWIDDDMIVPYGDGDWFNKVTGFHFLPEFANINLVDRLLSHGKTVVGALYFGRNPRQEPMYNEGMVDWREKVVANRAPQDLIKATAWVGTGALLVHRSVYSDIQLKFPTLAPQNEKEGWHYFSRSETELAKACELAVSVINDEKSPPESRLAKAKELLWLAQSRSIRQNSLSEGEDVTFCKRAFRAGHQPYVDFGAVCGHVGPCVYGPQELVTS